LENDLLKTRNKIKSKIPKTTNNPPLINDFAKNERIPFAIKKKLPEEEIANAKLSKILPSGTFLYVPKKYTVTKKPSKNPANERPG